MIDPGVALIPWAVPGSPDIRASLHGTNNRTYVVAASSGKLILRIYPHGGDAARIRYEHALLNRLQGATPSFETPLPPRTSKGDTFAVGDTAPDDVGRRAPTLSP